MVVLLITHILVALTSIVLAMYLLWQPKAKLLYVNYGLIGTTLASGTVLVLAAGSNALHAVLSGAVYLTVVTSGTWLARKRLAHNAAAHVN